MVLLATDKEGESLHCLLCGGMWSPLNSVLSLSLPPSAPGTALPGPAADPLQEDREVQDEQHPGGGVHHHPRVPVGFCQHGGWLHPAPSTSQLTGALNPTSTGWEETPPRPWGCPSLEILIWVSPQAWDQI